MSRRPASALPVERCVPKDSSVSAQLLDGKTIAQQIQRETAEEVVDFIGNNSIVPTLAAILVGKDPASQVYVRNKRRACEHVGIESQLYELPESTDEDTLLQLVARLNKSHEVHGILVQLPLPRQIDAAHVLDAVSPWKDVDAFHPENVGRLAQGRPRFLPCTPHGIQQILHRSNIPVAGKRVVIVGRSDIVGKPLAMMLMQRDSALGPSAANATVTVCHSRTHELNSITRQADILVAAVGQPRLITAAMIKPQSTVVDVGIHRTDSGLIGDVDFAAAREIAQYITPVPGGVGPLTIAMLMKNTLAAAEMQIA
jgi:methylenetetrahydrofolate dehydrogenase (NADP+)/methenyltetrahydrofolate cyclohydrolase